MRVINSQAIFSHCRLYRYALWRTWNTEQPTVMFIGLNPSTADEVEDDQTIRRCMRFARGWGYGGLVMTNLFALRATNPKDMLAHPAPVGPKNDEYLQQLGDSVAARVACWGAWGGHRGRDNEVIRMLGALQCLGLTQAGQPRHPSRLLATTQPRPFERRDVDALRDGDGILTGGGSNL